MQVNSDNKMEVYKSLMRMTIKKKFMVCFLVYNEQKGVNDIIPLSDKLFDTEQDAESLIAMAMNEEKSKLKTFIIVPTYTKR